MAWLWVPAALLAGLIQAWRTAVQQRLRDTLSVNGAGLVRYLYGVPIVAAMLTAYLIVSPVAAPAVTSGFMLSCGLAALAQIVATNLLIMAFRYRNFVVGTAFSKTETIQAAIFGALFLGEMPSVLVWSGILLGVAGVLLLALGGRGVDRRDLFAALTQPAARCGLASGALFALTGVLVRHAADTLGEVDPVLAGLTTLALVVPLQSAGLCLWVAWREPATLRTVLAEWRTAAQVGLLSAIGSACLFTALAVAPVALVRIVAQIEVVFTLAFAHLYLHESFQHHEVVGLAMVAGGVLLALVAVT